VDSKLKRLIKTGIITLDGERYRYNPQRPLTPDEERQFDDIQRASTSCPLSEKAEKRLWTAEWTRIPDGDAWTPAHTVKCNLIHAHERRERLQYHSE